MALYHIVLPCLLTCLMTDACEGFECGGLKGPKMRQSIFQYRMIGECPLFRRIGEKNKRVEYLKDGLVPEVYS